MRISLYWIKELVNIQNINTNNVIEKLTLGGFEVEEVLELIINDKKEIILDVTATANRADSLSVKGIAKEVAALLNKPYNISKYSHYPVQLEKIVKSPELIACKSNFCKTFLAITVENLTTLDSPKWLKQKLFSAGILPVNNLLDFQNYILLETGYPFEFYDLDKIKAQIKKSSFQLRLTSALDFQNFVASNQIQYKLSNEILTVKIDDEVLSIAGLISNVNFQYLPNTKSLLIEGAIFNSKKIRQVSRSIGLRTDRSARYEKGLNESYFLESIERLLYLLKASNSQLICKIHTLAKSQEKVITYIYLKYQHVIEILGPIGLNKTNVANQLTPTQISEYLNRLNFQFTIDEKILMWKVKIPILRSDDITREIDLIEEIGRLHGFNNFIPSLPKIKKIGKEDFNYQTRKKIISCLLNEGFDELVHYSLVKNDKASEVKIVNPLLSDYSTLRSTLLFNILKTRSNNTKQGNLNLEGFECGRIFSGSILSNYLEIEQLGGIFGGIKLKTNWSENSKFLSWFEAKGKIENIFDKLNLLVYWKNQLSRNYKNLLHPYRTSNLYLSNGILIGIFGQIHPILANQLSIPLELYLFEFNFEVLKDELKYNQLSFYQNYSVYPKIIKDLSFIINQKVNFKQIKNVILSNTVEHLVSIELLDQYKGNSIPKKMVSLCIQLTFQSFEKTLLNKEIEETIMVIESILIQNFGIILRA